jgi:hypothetical protein
VTAVATPTRTPLRERLILLLGAMAYGLHPAEDCTGAVQDAATDPEAIRVYDACLLSLAGITAGGDAGNENEMTIPGVGN